MHVGIGSPSKPAIWLATKLLESNNIVSTIPVLKRVLIIGCFLLGVFQTTIFLARAVSLTKDWIYLLISGFGIKFPKMGIEGSYRGVLIFAQNRAGRSLYLAYFRTMHSVHGWAIKGSPPFFIR